MANEMGLDRALVNWHVIIHNDSCVSKGLACV